MIVRIAGRVCNFNQAPQFGMSMLNDYFTKKTIKKQQAEFKKQMQYLANKPNFTLMDYKQRIEDELSKIKSQFKAKLNKETQEQEKDLEMEKKVTNALFEEELNLESRIKFEQKKEIALVTQLSVDFVSKVLKKFEEYKSMQRVLRSLRLNNEPLPETVKELQQLYLMNAASRNNRKFKYNQYKQVHQRIFSTTSSKGSDILKSNTITNTSSDHSPKLPYFFFKSYIFSRITDCFRETRFTRLFSRLFVLRSVSLRGTPSILNSEAKLRSKKRSQQGSKSPLALRKKMKWGGLTLAWIRQFILRLCSLSFGSCCNFLNLSSQSFRSPVEILVFHLSQQPRTRSRRSGNPNPSLALMNTRGFPWSSPKFFQICFRRQFFALYLYSSLIASHLLTAITTGRPSLITDLMSAKSSKTIAENESMTQTTTWLYCTWAMVLI